MYCKHAYIQRPGVLGRHAQARLCRPNYLRQLDELVWLPQTLIGCVSSVKWVLKEHTENGRMHWFISNVVTHQSNSQFARTYMNLGEGLGEPDNANYIVLDVSSS